MRFILIIFATLLFNFSVLADLINPNPNILPEKVISIQLEALMKNDMPYQDAGISQTWEFAHPNNQKYTGPLNRFIDMLKGQSYRMLLNHIDHKIIEVQLTNSIASYEVTVLDINKKYYKFTKP